MESRKNWIKELDTHIANRLQLIRTEKGLTQKEVAKILKVSVYQLQKYETGINRISVGRLLLLSRELRMDINNFYEGYERVFGDTAKLDILESLEEYEPIFRNIRKIKDIEYRKALSVIIIALGKARTA
jgi:transcriptional regulator with XRE-family HTH domain